MAPTDNRPTFDEIVAKLRTTAGGEFEVREIGSVTYPERSYPIIRISRPEPLLDRPTVCIIAGFHGEEPAGPTAIHEHIDEILRIVHEKKLNLVLFPCANSWGYDRSVRHPPGAEATNSFTHNPKGVARESEIIKTDLERFAVDYYLDLHEDDENNGAYIYAFGNRDLSKRILGALTRHVPLESNPKMDDPTIMDADICDGIVWNAHDGSSEDWISHRGAKLSICTETPSSFFPLPVRTAAQMAAIREIFVIAGRPQGVNSTKD